MPNGPEERQNGSDLLLAALLAIVAVSTAEDPVIADLAIRVLRRNARLTEAGLTESDFNLLLEMSPSFSRRARRLEEAREIANAALDGFRGPFEAQINERLSDLSARLSDAEGHWQRFEVQHQLIFAEATTIKQSLHDLIWLLSTRGDVASAHIKRYVPVRLYFDEPVPSSAIIQRLVQGVEYELRRLGFVKSYDLADESGSLWKRFFAESKDFINQKEVAERLKKLEQSLEIKHLNRPQAEATQVLAEATSKIMAALDDVENACMQIGNILVVKITDLEGGSSVVTKTLTFEEQKTIEENQSILKSPAEVLELLQKASARPKRRLSIKGE